MVKARQREFGHDDLNRDRQNSVRLGARAARWEFRRTVLASARINRARESTSLRRSLGRSFAPRRAGLRLTWLLVAGLACGASVHAGPSVRVLISTNFYVVTGTNAQEIRASTAEARPWKQTSKYDAQTSWDTKCGFSYRQEAGQFALSSFEVKTTITVTLPRWVPPKGYEMDRDLAARWWQYLKGLSRHEQGHVQIAREAAVELQRRLSALPGSPSVKELTTAANRTAKETVDEARKKEHDYDQETNHGMTQGAFFPHGRVKATQSD